MILNTVDFMTEAACSYVIPDQVTRDLVVANQRFVRSRVQQLAPHIQLGFRIFTFALAPLLAMLCLCGFSKNQIVHRFQSSRIGVFRDYATFYLSLVALFSFSDQSEWKNIGIM